MYNDKLAYLRREIKRNHKFYTGERQDGSASLSDVANFFNIPIDESRVDDYSIDKIDYSVPSITISDKRTNTKHIASYTYRVDLLNHFDSYVRFNNVVSVSPTHKIESVYFIGSDNPIIERLTINDGTFDLMFEREFPHNVTYFPKTGVQFSIKYMEELIHNGRYVYQNLLSRDYKEDYDDSKRTLSYEQFSTYDRYMYVEAKDSQDKYTYKYEDSIIYGINVYEDKEKNISLRGVCFENTDVDVEELAPFDFYVNLYPSSNDVNIKSAMIFNGRTKTGLNHIEIFKNGTDSKIKYYVRNFDDNAPCIDQSISVPLLSSGTITSEEIGMIITALQDEFNDDFIEVVSDELTAFGRKIDIRKGLIEEDNDKLSPKEYFDAPLTEVAHLVNGDKESFFNLAAEQFSAATNISQSKGNAMTLRQNKSSETDNS